MLPRQPHGTERSPVHFCPAPGHLVGNHRNAADQGASVVRAPSHAMHPARHVHRVIACVVHCQVERICSEPEMRLLRAVVVAWVLAIEHSNGAHHMCGRLLGTSCPG